MERCYIQLSLKINPVIVYTIVRIEDKVTEFPIIKK